MSIMKIVESQRPPAMIVTHWRNMLRKDNTGSKISRQSQLASQLCKRFYGKSI